MQPPTEWPRRKSPRLKDFDYATPNIVVLITIAACRKHRTFAEAGAARAAVCALREERERLGHAVYAYCVMPDHVHVLVSPLESGKPVPAFVQGFKSRVENALKSSENRGKAFQRSFNDHVIRKSESPRAAAEYILQNPVRSGLALKAEDYPFSGCIDPLPA